MKKQRKGVAPPRGYIGYFTLCQAIAGQLQDSAERIGKASIHAPVFHRQILAGLESTKGLCERAIEAVKAAQKEWGTIHAR